MRTMKRALAAVYLIYVAYVLATEIPSSDTSKAGKTEQPPIDVKIMTEEGEIEDTFEMDHIQLVTDEEEGRKITVGRMQKEYPMAFNLKLDYFNLTMSLKMKINKNLMGIKPTLIYYDTNGSMIMDDDYDDDCSYYQGYDLSINNSSATMTVCEDGMDGVIMTHGMQILVTPSKKQTLMQRSGNELVLGPHVLKESKSRMHDKYRLDFIDIPKNATGRSRTRRSVLSDTKYVEVYLVNDHSHYVWQGRNVQNNLKRMKQIVNIMDSLYEPYNINILLMALEVWNDGNKMQVDSSAETTLNNFAKYRQHNILPRFGNDCSVFVTRIDYNGPTVGLAPISGMCTESYSLNVNQDTNWDHSLLAGTLTHEMGHNFGMSHDAASCRCGYNNGSCMMSPQAQNPIPLLFSNCSENHLLAFFQKEMGTCLLNLPDFSNASYVEKTCGNNRLDPGEECDCGDPRFCLNPCCNAGTCRLTAGSQCYTGGCCYECKFKARNEVCRASIGTCDVDEKCDGATSTCPGDLFRQNGKECVQYNEDGYCYNGRCQSLLSQCRFVWGGSTKVANKQCFGLNTRGDRYGHCGTSGNNFRRCAAGDVLCGRLFCIDPPGKLPVVGRQASKEEHYFNFGGKVVGCFSGLSDMGMNAENPFLGFTGVKCGDGRACQNTRCVSVSAIASPPCPDNCNSRGICTHKGTCNCNSGWAPPNCKDKVQATTPTPSPSPSPSPTPDPASGGKTPTTTTDGDNSDGCRTVGSSILLYCLAACAVYLAAK